MKKAAVFFVLASLFNFSAFAFSPVRKFISCKGQAEFNKIQIQELLLSSSIIHLKYKVNGSAFEKQYFTTEFMKKNGKTDLREPAYFIGGTESGNKNDYEDISLPHYGNYKDGLGSEVAFNHDGQRVFGDVLCSIAK